MRPFSFVIACLLAACSLRAVAGDDVEAVFARSQQQRLNEVVAMAAADSQRTAVVRATFARVRDSLEGDLAVELLVVDGDVAAEALGDHLIAANESLADLPEGERAFVIAHELGHILLRHGSKRVLLFRENLPAEFDPDRVDAANDRLARVASALAHRQELEADAFALDAIGRLGYGTDVAVAIFRRQPSPRDTATHPSASRRIANLLRRVAD